MKRLLTIAVVFVIFLVGCPNQESNVTGPNTDTGYQFSKESKILTNTNLRRLTPDLVPFLLTTVTKVIDGSFGGIIILKQNVLNSDGRIVEVNSEFKITAGAFNGTQSITITTDVDNGCISFYPHMNFNKTCYLNFALKNVDLANLGFHPNDTAADFVFFNDNGTIDPIANKGFNL